MSPQTDSQTVDAFLDGRVRLTQPRKGYRAGVDPVLLAAAVDARGGQSVLELGCGVGAALYCLNARVPGLSLTGIERQRDYVDLARTNAQQNGAEARIVACDLTALPAEIRQERFDHVIANPPYFHRARGTASPLPAREEAMGEETPLETWVAVAARRLAPKGYLTMIQNAARLPELLAAVSARLGSVAVRPVSPRCGRAAGLVLLQARKGGRAEFRMLAPLIMHDGDKHLADRDDYSPLARQVLRDGAPLAWLD